ncbi:hypothetical protein PanWU01x14_046390 [Parasponia andersonii]|uniref:Uncharacterized protein n=1 Tax=Parasponia andersonii TaxID=3476 RepID=A0A2P5DNQ6_PARAD|nr:hypothetical protein PanWU01x14_046390 [Parasponia andersonii]
MKAPITERRRRKQGFFFFFCYDSFLGFVSGASALSASSPVSGDQALNLTGSSLPPSLSLSDLKSLI